MGVLNVWLVATLVLVGEACFSQNTAVDRVDTTSSFRNPVFEPILADPTVIKASDGWFYAYGTQDDWGDGKGSRLVSVVRSRDLTQWTYLRNAFDTKPSWKASGGIWAPDIALVNGKYHLYYAFSTWGDANPGIGLAVSDSPAGPFHDLGKLFLSSEVNVPNSIDPFYFENKGRKYLFWGSYSNAPSQGTYGVELSSDGKTIPELSSRFKVAAGDFEAVAIFKRDGYFYFFGSKGGCCDGEKSNNHLRMGRSKALLGPYIDKEGRALTERGAGSLLLQGNEVYAGPGHNARIVTDNEGTDWMLYHAIDKKRPYVSSKANRRVLMLDKISWNDGWPEIKGEVPGVGKQLRPILK